MATAANTAETIVSGYGAGLRFVSASELRKSKMNRSCTGGKLSDVIRNDSSYSPISGGFEDRVQLNPYALGK